MKFYSPAQKSGKAKGKRQTNEETQVEMAADNASGLSEDEAAAQQFTYDSAVSYVFIHYAGGCRDKFVSCMMYHIANVSFHSIM